MAETTILLSTYNGQDFLRSQLDSIFAQTYKDFDILIRDDSSNDKTTAILDEYAISHSNLNYYKGSNLGAANSFIELLLNAPKSKYYAFCDQDDVWLPTKLEVAIKKLESFQNCDYPVMYCSSLVMVDKDMHEIGKMHEGANPTKGNALVDTVCTGCTIVFNHKVKDIIQMNRPNRIVMHDFLVFHICMYLGHVIFDSTPYIYYRQHGRNVLGAQVTFMQKMKMHIKSLQNIKNQHYREIEAQLFLKAYGHLLQDDDKRIISLLANYRKSIIDRIKLLFSKEIYCNSFSANFWLKFRIIIGKV